MPAEKFDLLSYYRNVFKESGNSYAIATLKTLLEFLKRDETSTTVVGLRDEVIKAIEQLKYNEPVVVIESVSEIFLRFISLDISKYENFKDLKEGLIRRSNLFIQKVVNSRKSVARFAQTFIEDGSFIKPTKILMHSKSQAVLETLKEAVKLGKHIKVYVTESAPNYEGREMHKLLEKEGIESELIIDASIGIYIEEADMIMTGAEGVTESGGIINKVGTLPLAMLAKAYNKPYYVLAESYKFLRIYPLNQKDIPDRFKYRISNPQALDDNSKRRQVHVDYTPPQFISLILTDVGPLTTAAISDELMKLYL